ncbi:helix-turn-helix domain-containing protein [Sphingobacterium sp. LRF_L2]|uniref:AraC family transcriptional regulator n=1 Tax=Sphingobacterium sp. LRF_L2 TaxID=3369421 RepID=UPI003F5E1F20
MQVRLYDPAMGHTLLEKEYPDSYSVVRNNVIEYDTIFNHPIGDGSYKEIYFDGVHIGYGHAKLKKEAKFSFESDFESVEMHFALEGKSLAKSHNFGGKVLFEANQHNIIYANQMSGEMEWTDSDFRLFEVNLAPKFFQKYLPQESALFERFNSTIAKRKSGLLHKNNQLITHNMGQIIWDIIQCDRTGMYKKMFLESKVIELLLLQMEQMDCKEANYSIKKGDIDKIYAVKEFLTTHLDEQHSLLHIAHRFGTNEFTLKKGFKELFGTTVFGFWNDLKMIEAKKMLLEMDMRVGEVADAIGYQNSRHFSTAFSKKFGVSPSRLKNNPLKSLEVYQSA